MNTTTTVTITTDDGARLHIATAGDPDAPLTAVLCHGYMLDSSAWHFQLPALGESARLVLYDQRGHGRSTLGAAPVTIERLGEDLHQVLAATVPHGPVVLVGHSMGGMAIMAMAAAHPDFFGTWITGIALLSTSAGQLNGTPMGLPPAGARLLHQALAAGLPRLARLPATVDAVRRHTGLLAFRLTRPLLYRAPVDPTAARITINAMARVPVTAIAACYPALMVHDQYEALPAMGRCPVLVAVGINDQITPATHSATLAERIPSAELAVVPGAAHLLPLQRPGDINALLLALLSRSMAAPPPGLATAPAAPNPGGARPADPGRGPDHASAAEHCATARPHPYVDHPSRPGSEPDREGPSAVAASCTTTAAWGTAGAG